MKTNVITHRLDTLRALVRALTMQDVEIHDHLYESEYCTRFHHLPVLELEIHHPC